MGSLPGSSVDGDDGGDGQDAAAPTGGIAPMSAVRRVVTGHNAAGDAVFASDEQVQPITVPLAPGWEYFQLWGGDEPPEFPDDGSPPAHTTYFPPVGGFRFSLVTIPPDRSAAPLDDDALEAALAETEAELPGMISYLEPDAPGMHTTATIDFEVVLRGEITLELDNGERRTMRVGDTIVQNGTRHRWLNSTTESALIAVFGVGADHEGVS